jgi:hypothetical protein
MMGARSNDQKETGQQCKMIFVFDGVRMNTFPSRAGAAVRGGVARPRSAAPSLGAFARCGCA